MKIPVNEPVISQESKTYVNDCLDTGWISSAGTYVHAFESAFAAFCGTDYAVTTTNGTTALHLALEALEIGEGDEVIIPDLTIISCALAALYVGARPILVDVDAATGNIDPLKIEEAITAKTKAIMVVHLYGHPCDMDAILAIAKKHSLKVIEDAAEAHGAEYKGKKVGSFGDVACFSFYGNKIISTGEGGMLVTNNSAIAERAALLKDLAHKPGRRFFHEVKGYNFRMTNLQAALGLGALEHVNEYIKKKRFMASTYTELLSTIQHIKTPTENADVFSVYWMYALEILPSSPVTRDECMKLLQEAGVETRTYFLPLHEQPVLLDKYPDMTSEYPVSTELSRTGFYIPSGLALTKKQITFVAATLQKIFR